MSRDLLSVSVIIPVHNGERFLASTVESALAQDSPPLEVIVVDDGSTDRTAAIARSFPAVRYVSQVNQGPGAARNAGIAAARGELIAFLDADDLWAGHKLSAQARCLAEDPGADYALCHLRHFLQPGVQRPAWLQAHLLAHPCPAYLPSALLARRRVFERIGGFDAARPHAEDFDWFLRAKDAGLRPAVLHDVLLYRRIHGTNRTSQAAQIKAEMLRLLKASIVRKRRQQADGGE